MNETDVAKIEGQLDKLSESAQRWDRTVFETVLQMRALISDHRQLRGLLAEACEIASDAISQEASGMEEGKLSYFDEKNRWTERLKKIVEAAK